MAAPAPPVWRALGVCPADPLAPSHPQANHSQSQGCRGEVSEETQHLIGDGFSDWMTEEVDFSSYLPNPPSPPSPTNASLPPSPLQNDTQVPSDLEVMTSLLQEELAQLEDYFLSEPLPEKGPKFGRCDKGPPPAGPQAFCQVPYASYSASGQSESSPLLVTLATGELDLLSICGGPIGRSKIPRHAPYSCSRPKRLPDGARLGDEYENSLWSSRGNNSGNLAVTFNGSYGCVEDEQAGGKGYCAGDAVEIRRCVVPPKEEKSYCIGQDVGGGDGKAFFPAFGFGAALDVARKEEDASMYSGRAADGGAEALDPVKAGGEATRAGASWKTGSHDGCYLPPTPQSEAYHGFFAGIGEQVKAESLQAGQHHPHHAFLDDQGPACLLMTREGLDLDPPGRRQECMLSEDHCALTYDLEGTPLEGGERKQKKRDQNKTAAHRYRQRKRAELDVLEEQLHGLEGRNRELRDKAESVEREIQYVKDLLIEVYKARSQRLKQDATA